MKYDNISSGIFLNRPNRFIAEVLVNGKVEICHVKNTGKCKELLIPSETTVFINKSNNPDRKTKFDLISVKKGDLIVNMDSQAPNKIVLDYIQSGNLIKNPTKIKPEYKYNNSRFDLYAETLEKNILIEVKGVTLEKNKIAMFPDAPTIRGIKHMNELAIATQNGFDAYIIFAIQLEGTTHFTTNNETHKAFGETLQYAISQGVKAIALECTVTENSISISKEIPILL